ncbi:ABC transporter substrate-binding protein [Bacillus sp. T33-2]|uniref:ABC transporter substrate-binding protein n=1 Tax=Bacillus sp. T33-2 TaxID=2054168 RepID=UPI000C76F4DA|nr:ABC transporter substrate-binding protein [Bacillus sp. T33-2]PLR94699.1 ABC transporter substrate-binding protein [Bacillus sp. T33-2]
MKKSVFMLITLMLVLSSLLIGCADSETTSKDKEDKKTDGKKVELFSWWTRGGEADGLNAIIDSFAKSHKDIEVVNATVAGGAGSNAKAVLATRMQGGDPPDLFQVHAGAELNGSWVESGKMEPLTDLYEEEGWMDKFPESLISMISSDGEIYSVPVNIHRGNELWYNKKLFDENGLEVPKTFDDFFKVADALKKKGITPFGFGSKEGWESLHVFETVLVGTLGVDNYNKLWTGEQKFDSPEVKDALKTFLKMLSYANEDHPARSWQDAATLIQEDKAAMTIMGDWLQGYYTSVGMEANKDYGYAPSPNNGNIFMVVSDTFALPKGAKNSDAAREFLKVLGSVEGQDAFNPKKGSIPARIDAGKGDYSEYLKDQMEEFKTNELTASIAHGSAAKEGFVTEANKIVNTFVAQKDVDDAAKKLQEAADNNLK